MPPHGDVRYGLMIAVFAVEATLSVLTWAAFNAEARLQKDHYSDIRDAMAGYGSGMVIPAVASLIEAVLDVRRVDEPILDSLDRADTSEALQAVVEAATVSGSPRAIELGLVRAWTVLAVASLLVQITGLTLLLNAVANRHLTGHPVRTVCVVLLSGSGAILIGSAIIVRHRTRSLSRAIRAGQDAADAA